MGSCLSQVELSPEKAAKMNADAVETAYKAVHDMETGSPALYDSFETKMKNDEVAVARDVAGQRLRNKIKNLLLPKKEKNQT